MEVKMIYRLYQYYLLSVFVYILIINYLLSVFVYILINSYEFIIPDRGVVSRHAHYASVDIFIVYIQQINNTISIHQVLDTWEKGSVVTRGWSRVFYQ